MKLFKSSPFFSGLPVRDFLSRTSYKATSVDTEVALSLVLPTDDSIISARRNSHLTNATDRDHQIRFPLKDRVKRSIIKLADEAKNHALDTKQNLPEEVYLLKDDFVSVEFFKTLSTTKITYIENSEIKGLSEAEAQLLALFENVKANLDKIIEWSRDRIYAADYRSAYQILMKIPITHRTDQVTYMLGLCTNFFGNTMESEIYFRAMHVSKDALTQVKASYVLSMLYLRMHPKELQNINEAESLLNSAFAVLTKHPEIEDWTFHRVFNRNGYALCLYRRGQINEALSMLEEGIAELKKDEAGARKLHQSVLIYNAVQCLRSLGQYEECEKKCLELLTIDPLFPEYHMEQARVFMEQQKWSDALKALKIAERLDSYIPEVYALLGFARLQGGDLPGAAEAYAQAANLEPSNLQHVNDRDYCLAESNQ